MLRYLLNEFFVFKYWLLWWWIYWQFNLGMFKVLLLCNSISITGLVKKRMEKVVVLYGEIQLLPEMPLQHVNVVYHDSIWWERIRHTKNIVKCTVIQCQFSYDELPVSLIVHFPHKRNNCSMTVRIGFVASEKSTELCRMIDVTKVLFICIWM